MSSSQSSHCAEASQFRLRKELRPSPRDAAIQQVRDQAAAKMRSGSGVSVTPTVQAIVAYKEKKDLTAISKLVSSFVFICRWREGSASGACKLLKQLLGNVVRRDVMEGHEIYGAASSDEDAERR